MQCRSLWPSVFLTDGYKRHQRAQLVPGQRPALSAKRSCRGQSALQLSLIWESERMFARHSASSA